jgi:iron complex transport system permease protein
VTAPAAAGPRAAALPLLAILLLAVVVANVAIGAVAIPPARVLALLTGQAGAHAQQASVLWSIRLPRAAVGLLVGAGLGIAGAALQGIFRNPLADPQVIGVSSGAAVGAVGAILAAPAGAVALAVPLAAFAGGLAAATLVYLAARSRGRTEIVTLILTGVAVNALGFATVGLAQYAADDDQLRTIAFWLLGSLAGALWRDAAVVAPLLAVGSAWLLTRARVLDLLALGEREAASLGVAIERERLGVVAAAALVVGAAVAVSGIIAFVGLVVPHLLRLALGPGHRLLLPASLLGGAALLLLADLVARTVAAPAELRLGVVTAFAGTPVFLWLLRRTRRAQGGWA